MQLPTIARSQGILTREDFHVKLALVNSNAKLAASIETQEAKDSWRKASALKAWAQYDNNLTAEEKKEANRAMTRTIRMLAEVAEREQPQKRQGGRGSLPGPSKWLQRELGVSSNKANSMRRLVTQEDVYRTALDTGRHWLSVAVSSGGNRRRTASSSAFNTFNTYIVNTNSMAAALKVSPSTFTRELARSRRIKAWLEAFEHALVQRQARERKAS